MADLKNVSEWFREAAETEANTPITAGLTRVGEVRYPKHGRIESVALAKLIELRRRQCGLSTEELAMQADVNLEDVVNIERGEGAVPELRTVRQIVFVLKLPEKRVLQLAGLSESRDRHLREATVEFAARAEPVEKLTPEEHKALEEFVSFLASDLEPARESAVAEHSLN
jgi:transcriptional regulator with XRE-family HTH domain